MVKELLIGVVKGYQVFISPLTAPSCRFHPSCSQYTREALQQYGVLKGLCFGVKRLLRCHPYSEGGFDPLNKKQGEV